VKETNSIINKKLCDKVIIICRRKLDERAYFHDNPNVKVIHIKDGIKFKSKNIFFEAIRFVLFYIKTFVCLLKMPFSFINAHSIHILPIAVFLKIVKRDIQLIYDPHELETEVSGAKGMKKWVARFIEGICIKYIDNLIVVSPSIKTWYINEYRDINEENTFVIRNIPVKQNASFEKFNLFREEFSIPEDELIFLYQGNISIDRGCQKIVNIFKKLSKHHIVFMGNGDSYLDKIKQLSNSSYNFHYKESVHFEKELPKYTSSADVGLHFIEVNEILNHKYCLPNKLFEYIINGLPVIVNSKAIDMTDIVEGYRVGFGVDTDNKELTEAIKLIEKLSMNDTETFRNAIPKVRLELCWEREAEQYYRIFKK
jgi:glycosyltransferase involved in cell wall biosynthesis